MMDNLMTAEEFVKKHFNGIENNTEWYPAIVSIAEGYSWHINRKILKENEQLKFQLEQKSIS